MLWCSGRIVVKDILLYTVCFRTVVRNELTPGGSRCNDKVCVNGDTVLLLAEVNIELRGRTIIVEAAVSTISLA